jgi:hypothetical protein
MYKEFNKKRFALFNKLSSGLIVGLCNDSFRMSYRYNCVYVWKSPPSHYFKPARGDFIICLNRKYDDVEVLPLIKENHTFKRNFLFRQFHIDKWHVYKDIGPVTLTKG